jgi:hypothetical protein
MLFFEKVTSQLTPANAVLVAISFCFFSATAAICFELSELVLAIDAAVATMAIPIIAEVMEKPCSSEDPVGAKMRFLAVRIRMVASGRCALQRLCRLLALGFE